MDELKAVRTFLAVAELQSFAAAARRLSTTTASVSRAVSGLEKHLDVQLFVRTTRQVSLTSAGASYAARIAPVIEDFDQAAHDIRSQSGSALGRIHVSAPMSMGMRVLPDLLSDFGDEFPGIEVSVTMTDEFVDIIKENYDLAIRISGPPDDKSTIWRKICLVERILVAASGSRFAKIDTPNALTASACLGYDANGGEEIWELRSATAKHSLTAGRTFSTNNGDLLARMVENGKGIALLPRFIVKDALAKNRIVQILPEWRPPDIWLTLYYPPYERLPAKVAAFSDFFERHVTDIKPLSTFLD
ncbi:MAG: LysR substrate-binding domain-containing protein [Pseudomonadota bacterium]